MADFLKILFMAAFVLGGADRAFARAPMASLVVDGHTGKVLYSRHANSRRYPASLTKIMTLYVLFQEMNLGRISNNTRMKVSRRASGQSPSKLGLKPGQSIRAIHAIKALVTKSANDVAVVVAEHISGTEWKFAKRMTNTARRLGMKRTTFANASGLPNRYQVTTARDMVTLSRAIYRDFPEKSQYFKLRSFKYKGRRYSNHNRLLGRYRGMEGIKTGYTRAAGYNLTTSVRRNNRHIVAAVLGGNTGRQRNNYMAYILNRSMPRAVARANVKPRRAKIRVAEVRPAKRSSNRHVVKIEQRSPESRLENRLLTSKIATIVARPATTTVAKTAAAPDKPAAIPATPVVITSKQVVPERPRRKADPVVTASTPDPWNIQVGAYAQKSNALERVADARRAAARLLKGRSGFAMEAEKDGKTFYRARFGLNNRRTAQLACGALKRKHIACIVLRN